MRGVRAAATGRETTEGVAAVGPAGDGGRLGPRAADRTLEILDLLARRQAPLALGEIGRLLGIPKASLSDLLKPLVARTYLRRDERGHFTVGPATVALARAVLFSGELVHLARPYLEQLSRASGETALIASLDEASMVSVYMEMVEADSPIRYTVPVGLRRELHATSVGKVLLAHLPPRRLERFLAERRLEPFTARTTVDADALARELTAVRRDGFATTEDERTAGASGVAAPILDAQGRCIAGLVLAGPTSRVRPVRKRLIALVRETASEISTAIRSISATMPLAEAEEAPAALSRRRRP